MKHVFARRLGVLALGSTLALGSIAPAAQADTTPSTTAAGRWLTGELVGGLIPSQFGGDGSDYGLSIDAAFTALAAEDPATATGIRDALAREIDDYISGEAFGDTGSTYANAVAKAAALVQRTGGDPRSFGGRNLVERLEAAVQDSGGLRDTSQFGDNANTLGQAFAVEVLTEAGSSKAAAARTFLVQQQCAAGFFREGFDSAADPTCDGAATPATGSVDATGLAVNALVDDPAGAPAVTRAVAWLTGTAQKADGSFGTSAATPASNANSTGLAGTALGATCAVPAAQRAAAALRTLQLPATDDRGAIALDRADYDAAQSAGAPAEPENRDRYRRATAQAAPALSFDPAAVPTVVLSGPTARVAKGSAQRLTLTGAARGETVCLTTPTGVQRLVGTGAPLSVPVTAPTRGSAAYSATTGPGAAAYALRAGRPKAQLRTKRVTAGATVLVKVRTLVPGSKVVTKIRGVKVDRTRARANGVAKVTFRLRGKAARAARVSSIRPGQVRKVTLRIKPAGSRAVKSTLRIARR